MNFDQEPKALGKSSKEGKEAQKKKAEELLKIFSPRQIEILARGVELWKLAADKEGEMDWEDKEIKELASLVYSARNKKQPK